MLFEFFQQLHVLGIRRRCRSFMLLPDGVYRRDAAEGKTRFVPVPVPSADELAALVRRTAERIGRSLERAGLITRDTENAYLAFDPSEEAPINSLIGHSITYRRKPSSIGFSSI